MNTHYVYSWNLIDENGFLHPFYIGAGNSHDGYFQRSYVVHRYDKIRKTRAQYKREKYEDKVFILIESKNLSLEERNKEEIRLIEEYKTIDEGGVLFNHTKGGDFNPMYDEKCRESWLKKIQSEEYKEKQRKISLSNWENKEYREKQLKNLSKCSIPIEYNGILYDSKKQLARFLGINIKTLLKRIEDNIPLDKNNSNKKIVKINGIIYNSIQEASRLSGLTIKHIQYWYNKGKYLP